MEMSWQDGSSLLLRVEKRTNDSWNQNEHGFAAKRVIKKCSPMFSESIAERSLFIFSQPVQRNADRSFCLYGYVCLG